MDDLTFLQRSLSLSHSIFAKKKCLWRFQNLQSWVATHKIFVLTDNMIW